jgi:dienelactone hydrolase
MVRRPDVRRLAGVVRALPVGGLLVVPARVAGFAGAQAVRARRPLDPEELLPLAAPTRALLAQVLLDEMVLALMKRPDRIPSTAEVMRIVEELAVTAALHRDRGWDVDPHGYHVRPPALTDVQTRRERWLHTPFERLSWPSEYEPWQGLPGRARWLDDERNRTAHALVLRHRGAPRPWVVCLHGLGTGIPAADIPGFRVRHLHHTLGFNVMLPTLPRHGPRGPGRLGAQTVLSYDHGDAVLAVAQAVWDVRRAIGWIRGQDGDGIAVHGVSLGGLVASLLATLDADYDAVIAGIPVINIPDLFRAHVPWRLRRRPWMAEVLGETAAEVHRVISPLAAAPKVPAERLYIYGGVGDRMVPPAQAVSLARHWDGAETLWFLGDHIGATWSKPVRRFIEAALLAHLSPRVRIATAGALPAVGQGSGTILNTVPPSEMA